MPKTKVSLLQLFGMGINAAAHLRLALAVEPMPNVRRARESLTKPSLPSISWTSSS